MINAIFKQFKIKHYCLYFHNTGIPILLKLIYSWLSISKKPMMRFCIITMRWISTKSHFLYLLFRKYVRIKEMSKHLYGWNESNYVYCLCDFKELIDKTNCFNVSLTEKVLQINKIFRPAGWPSNSRAICSVILSLFSR